VASYWSAQVGGKVISDIVWSYLDPIPECPKIRWLYCFFQEREAVVYLDGLKLDAPRTSWSRPQSQD
jgi:uncharacterized protein (DUF427 family)